MKKCIFPILDPPIPLTLAAQEISSSLANTSILTKTSACHELRLLSPKAGGADTVIPNYLFQA